MIWAGPSERRPPAVGPSAVVRLGTPDSVGGCHLQRVRDARSKGPVGLVTAVTGRTARRRATGGERGGGPIPP